MSPENPNRIKKNTATFAVVLLALVALIFYLSKTDKLTQENNKTSFTQDTAIANSYYRQAEALKGSKPDSAVLFYKKAIRSVQAKNQYPAVAHLSGLFHISLASLHCNLGKYDESRQYIKLAREIASAHNDIDIDGQADNVAGLLYYNQSDYPNALKYYAIAEKKAIESGNRKLRAKLSTNRAIINYLQGNFDKAVGDFKTTLQLAQQLKDKDLLAGTFMNLGLIYSNAGDYKNGIAYYNRALGMYKKMNGTDGMLLCLQNMANIYQSEGDYNKTIETHLQSLAMSIEIDDKASIAKEHNNLGSIYTRLGDYEKAISEYLKSIAIKEKLGDKEGESASYSGLGNLSLQQRDYNKALQYFGKALSINLQLNVIQGIASGYGNIANVYASLKEYNKAEKYYLKSIETYLKTDYKAGLSDSYLCLANLYRDRGLFDRAETYYQKCITIKESLGDKEGVASTYFEQAMLHLNVADKTKNNSRIDAALQCARKSDKLAHEIGALPAIANATLALKKAYQAKGDNTNALLYANEYMQINDSLFNQRKTEAITFAEARWNSNKKQQTINQLVRQKALDKEIIERKNHESQLQRLIIWGAGFILLLTIAIATITILYLRKRKDIQLQKQRSEMTNLRMQNARNTLSPHFLFNVLGSISGIVNQPDLVRRKINSLSVLLRQTLENIDKTTISIEDELHLVKNFIELQWDRVPGRFETHYRIDEQCNLKQLIPAMLIQIPVENAIKHGLMPLPEEADKKLIINIEEQEKATIISVTDNGVGLYATGEKTRGTGTGLKVLLQTINHLNTVNKEHIVFDLTENQNENGENQGTLARITIPKQFNFNK